MVFFDKKVSIMLPFHNYSSILCIIAQPQFYNYYFTHYGSNRNVIPLMSYTNYIIVVKLTYVHTYAYMLILLLSFIIKKFTTLSSLDNICHSTLVCGG